MELCFFGAARTVTGACFLLRTRRWRLLIDCGLFQGRRAEARQRNERFPFDPTTIDAVVLTHAHIDHSGNLPRLVKLGFAGPIYATPPTIELLEILLSDSAHIQEHDAEYLRRHRGEQIEPLYTLEDIVPTLARCIPLEYHQPMELLPGVVVRLFNAGHILGSAQIVLEVRQGAQRLRIGITGDVGRRAPLLLPPPEPLPEVDVLLCESTYGARRHEPAEQVRQRLQQLFTEVAHRRGVLLIPAFSVGRTQELLYHLNALFNAGQLPEMPIFVDSPLAERATRCFRRHLAAFNAEVQQLLQHDPDPFGFERVRFTLSVEESKQIHQHAPPFAVIAGSAMCESGRILHHLKRYIGEPSTTVLFVGYNAAHTLGRRLVEGVSPVRIFGELYPVRARVEELSGLSAHADAEELIAHLEPVPLTTSIVLVHGEPEQQEAFSERLRAQGFSKVLIPELGQCLEL
jgi:metallo-beta-lactamase family protein